MFLQSPFSYLRLCKHFLSIWRHLVEIKKMCSSKHIQYEEIILYYLITLISAIDDNFTHVDPRFCVCTSFPLKLQAK